MKIKLRNVKLSQLNNNCISLILKFIRVLRSHNGKSLRLTDSNILMTVFQEASNTDNPELIRLAKHLRQQIRVSFRGDFEEKLTFQEYKSLNDLSSSDAA